ncbi:MAG: hypothetical protein L3K01_02530 [Thermoplasmata archaeon]|nr:hypothetical protein [Thermoplasmata archaeon]
MDVPLYAIALILFALLYLAVSVVLSFTLIITLVILFLYLTLRHGKMPENYPHGFGDALITAIFIGVTWGIFILLGPKSPIPFLPANGNLVYAVTPPIALNAIVGVGVVIAIVFLFIGSLIARQLREGSAGTGSGSSTTTTAQSDSKPKQGVGA